MILGNTVDIWITKTNMPLPKRIIPLSWGLRSHIQVHSMQHSHRLWRICSVPCRTRVWFHQ